MARKRTKIKKVIRKRTSNLDKDLKKGIMKAIGHTPTHNKPSRFNRRGKIDDSTLAGYILKHSRVKR